MKRNIFQILADRVCPAAMTILLAGGLLAACSDEVTESGQGRPLPEGEYPVMLTTVLEPATRATGDGTWVGGECVSVESVQAEVDWEQAEVKFYEASPDGRLTSGHPFWWRSSGERKKVRAWYCGDGSNAPGKEHASVPPEFWSVQADQSGDGYHASDLLFAPEIEAAFTDGASAPLRFLHQTAKVVVNIRKSDYAASAEMIKSVRMGDMVLSGEYFFPEVNGNQIGGWRVDKAGNEKITLRRLEVPADGEYIASFDGLVIPQETSRKRLLIVETEAGSCIYTTPADAAPFEEGKVTAYNITIKDGPGDNVELDVDTVTGGEWTAGGEKEITSREVTAVYKADDTKPGDYFYSDGTTSDGGLRTLYADGTNRKEEKMPEEGKTVVGIVFQTDPERIGQAEKDALGGTARGLVMSLKNAATGVKWGPQTDNGVLENLGNNSRLYSDINGYANCAANEGALDTHPAFKAAKDYNTTCPVGGTTTGWFLPSSGQWWDFLQNLSGVSALADPAKQQNTSETGWEYKFEDGDDTDISAALNCWTAAIPDADKDEFVKEKQQFWTSSERSDKNAWTWIINPANLYRQGPVKTGTYNVRPILAF